MGVILFIYTIIHVIFHVFLPLISFFLLSIGIIRFVIFFFSFFLKLYIFYFSNGSLKHFNMHSYSKKIFKLICIFTFLVNFQNFRMYSLNLTFQFSCVFVSLLVLCFPLLVAIIVIVYIDLHLTIYIF